MATKPMTKSTAVAVKKPTTGAVVSMQDILRKQAAAVGEQIAPPSGITIRTTQDKKFQLPDGTKTEGPLDVVILDFVSMNTFYEGAYDQKTISPPACFALGTSPTKLAPSENSPLKQSDACSTCPMNQFGSNGDGKACKNMRVLAVLPPDAGPDTPIWILKTSPTANKGFDSFVASVAGKFQLPPIGVVAEVSFDDSVTYAKLQFGNPRPNAGLEAMFPRQEEARKMLLTEPDVSTFQPVKKAVGGRRR